MKTEKLLKKHVNPCGHDRRHCSLSFPLILSLFLLHNSPSSCFLSTSLHHPFHTSLCIIGPLPIKLRIPPSHPIIILYSFSLPPHFLLLLSRNARACFLLIRRLKMMMAGITIHAACLCHTVPVLHSCVLDVTPTLKIT